jgi:hypothetical protein
MDFSLQRVELRKKEKKKSEGTEEELLKFPRTAISMFGIAKWRTPVCNLQGCCKLLSLRAGFSALGLLLV